MCREIAGDGLFVRLGVVSAPVKDVMTSCEQLPPFFAKFGFRQNGDHMTQTFAPTPKSTSPEALQGLQNEFDHHLTQKMDFGYNRS